MKRVKIGRLEVKVVDKVQIVEEGGGSRGLGMGFLMRVIGGMGLDHQPQDRRQRFSFARRQLRLPCLEQKPRFGNLRKELGTSVYE